MILLIAIGCTILVLIGVGFALSRMAGWADEDEQR